MIYERSDLGVTGLFVMSLHFNTLPSSLDIQIEWRVINNSWRTKLLTAITHHSIQIP